MASSTDGYVLSRGAKESSRLEDQHRLYIKSLGYLLHPDIMSRLSASPRIADIGTGTGIVLRDLARDLPSAQMDGFDISAAQFPSDLPSNIVLHVADCKKPFPAEFLGKFEVVFLRCLITILEPPHDWEAMARNVAALLKPGGAVQWVESKFSTFEIIPGGADSSTAGLETLFGYGRKLMGPGRLGWDLTGLLDIFKAAGLVDVDRDVVSSDRYSETRTLATQVQINASYGAIQAMKAVEDQELQKIIAKVKRDMESGTYVRWEIHTYRGFKPY
ncbi:S-adenosyl-L-methionine-dependent methyltransferase [Xylariales sp. PMI_506]|nr:S-adenosyl-L-methionine-dependent methyltransferase [Xylariales sp. PMI_506]